MPYAPQVQDISGQLRAQGKLAQTAGVADGLQQGFKSYQENTIRNKALTGQNQAMLGVFMKDPELKNYAPEGTDKYIEKMMNGGGLSLKDSIQLNGMLNTTLATKKAVQEQKDMEQMAEYRKAQMGQIQSQMASRQKDQEGVAKTLRDLAGDVDPIAFARGASANGVSAATIADFLPKITDAVQQVPLKTVDYREDDPNTGTTKQVTVNARTGQEMGRGTIMAQPRVYPTATEAADIEGAKKEAELNAAANAEVLKSTVDAAETAQARVPQLKEMLDLYEGGATSGFGQDFITRGGALGRQLGIIDPKKQADAETLKSAFAREALMGANQLIKGQGSITENERKTIKDASASLDKSPEANLRIIRYSKAIGDRALDIEDERQRLLDGGDKPAAVAEKLRRYRTSHPLAEYLKQADGPKAKETVASTEQEDGGESAADMFKRLKAQTK